MLRPLRVLVILQRCGELHRLRDVFVREREPEKPTAAKHSEKLVLVLLVARPFSFTQVVFVGRAGLAPVALWPLPTGVIGPV